MPARRGRAPARRDQLQPRCRLHGARLRRRKVGALQPASVHRHDHPDPRRSVDGAARQARDELLRPVRAVPAGRRGRVGRCPARGVWRDRGGHDRGAGAEHPRPHPSCAGAHAQGHRGHVRPLGGQHLPGELSLEQLFFNRPVPGWARYRTPLRNLWMCGSATHPGGGVMGASGRLAALQVVRSL